MAHVRGHIVKGSGDKKAIDSFSRDGNFDTYLIKVIDYHSEYNYISDSDSKEVTHGDVIVVLTKNSFQLPSEDDFDMVLKVQSFFDYSSRWILNGKNNWLVFDEEIQHLADHH